MVGYGTRSGVLTQDSVPLRTPGTGNHVQDERPDLDPAVRASLGCVALRRARRAECEQGQLEGPAPLESRDQPEPSRAGPCPAGGCAGATADARGGVAHQLATDARPVEESRRLLGEAPRARPRP